MRQPLATALLNPVSAAPNEGISYSLLPCPGWDNSPLGGSRKYPYPYHGRHLGIPKGRGGYVDWNSEDMGGLRRLEF